MEINKSKFSSLDNDDDNLTISIDETPLHDLDIS